MTEPAEFMQRVDAKLDYAQATLDQHGRYLLELRALVTPAPVTRADVSDDFHPQRDQLRAMERRLVWRLSGVMAASILLVLVILFATR